MGIDIENQRCVSLIQVATNEKIYLLDLLNLTKIMNDCDIERISMDFFCNPKIIDYGK